MNAHDRIANSVRMIVFYKEIEFDFPTFINRLTISAELVIFGIVDRAVQVLMFERQNFPDMGKYAFPGCYMEDKRALYETIGKLKIALGIHDVELHQVATLDNPARDMGKRAVSVIYMGAMEGKRLKQVAAEFQNGIVLEPREKTYVDAEFYDGYRKCEVAFDHPSIVQIALRHLRRIVPYTEVGFDFLPKQFTMPRLQHVHEVVSGKKVNASTFRKRMLGLTFADDTIIQSTGLKPTGFMGAPPTLYERIPSHQRVRPASRKPKLSAR